MDAAAYCSFTRLGPGGKVMSGSVSAELLTTSTRLLTKAEITRAFDIYLLY